MQSIKLTESQKKILMISGIIALAFFFVWLFIFLPVRANVNKMKEELAVVEGQIRAIERDVSGTQTLAQGIQSLELRSKVLENKFPKDVEGSLKIISNLAEKFNIKIISLKPSLKKALVDENDKEVKVGGKSCEMIYVNLVMKGSYKDLIKYREMLEEGLPGFVAIEMLSIIRDDSNAPGQLTISLDFNLYLLN